MTLRVTVDPKRISASALTMAARMLRAGELVAFPTETVYGLGANALDAEAVQGIFAAKGRPADNPLIVHVSSKDMLRELVRDVPAEAEKLMAAFWPGPLTLVLRRTDAVPDAVSAGLDTVAVRMPSHRVAYQLIHAAQVPVAAPSANRSGRPSPTTAEHVLEDLRGEVSLVLDGGPCSVGVESTVLDMTAETPTILRPGGVTREQLEAVLGRVEVAGEGNGEPGAETGPRSPGMKYTHYAPTAPVHLVSEGKVAEAVSDSDGNVVVVARERPAGWDGAFVSVGPSVEDMARRLFAGLREADAQDPDTIIVVGVPEESIGAAVMNRLRKAASKTTE